VLSYQDLSITDPAYTLFLAHHVVKEVMAATNIFNSAQSIGSGLKL
jgi:hypothetical protein